MNPFKNKAVIDMKSASSTLDPDEISRFAKDAPRWWDESGPFAPLHRLNPARLGYIRTTLCNHFDRDGKSLKSLTGLNILDIGCGGGLVSEPLARLGAHVTGIDGDAVAISVAKDHATGNHLDITYLSATTDDLLADGTPCFDVVLALEIVEHVANVESFVNECVSLCKPGGIVIFSTLNKTVKSLALGKIAAEYLLRWVPVGTHDWKKFIRPSALAAALRRAGAVPQEAKGLVFNPLQNTFAMSDTDLDVNYFMIAVKEKP